MLRALLFAIWCFVGCGGAHAQTTVYNQAGVLTNSWGGNSLGNQRIVIPASLLTAATGNKISVSFLFFGGGSGGITTGTAYIGQAGATDPNFTGDQIQLTFSGSGTFSSPATAVAVTSDFVTLAQPFDVTKKYIVSFFLGSISGSFGGTLGFSSTDAWADTTSHVDDSSLTVPSPAMTKSAGFLLMVSQMQVQSSGGAVVRMPLIGVGP